MNVSIGIPVYNEEKNIEKLLNILSKEKFYREIIVVAGGDDNTLSIVREFRKRFSKIKLFEEKKRMGKATAINLILKKSKGEIILFIDSDTVPKKGAFNFLLKKMDKNVGAVCGRPKVIVNNFSDLPAAVIWDMHDILLRKFPKISGPFYVLRKGLIKKIPEKIINDDTFIAFTLLRNGYTIAYEPKALVYLKNKNNLISHLRRRSRISRGYLQLWRMGMNSFVPLPIILKVVAGYMLQKKAVIKCLFVIALEILANLLAILDFITGTKSNFWKR